MNYKLLYWNFSRYSDKNTSVKTEEHYSISNKK